MIIRQGFVSNSSSSSFVVAIPRDNYTSWEDHMNYIKSLFAHEDQSIVDMLTYDIIRADKYDVGDFFNVTDRYYLGGIIVNFDDDEEDLSQLTDEECKIKYRKDDLELYKKRVDILFNFIERNIDKDLLFISHYHDTGEGGAPNETRIRSHPDEVFKNIDYLEIY